MNRSSRGPNAAIATVCLALAGAVLAVPAGAATVHFEKESVQAYEAQLHHGQVHALTFHPGSTTGHLHISLNNGGHMTVAYVETEQGKLVAQAQAANARVKIATATTKKTTAVKHKLRYIAGGILIVVIIVVLIVLLIGRRRAVAEEGRTPSGESAAP
jgi:magnesium-transporting ATPase (P-type)